MKSKNYLLCGLALAFVFSLYSCKPKESAYKAAYEAAKAREVEENYVTEVTPVYKPSDLASDVTQKEKVTVVDGANILQYNVVVGSYGLKTNADKEKERWAERGFRSFLAQNENKLYRVIVATFNNKNSAVAERERVKSRYYPDYQDAWILDNR